MNIPFLIVLFGAVLTSPKDAERVRTVPKVPPNTPRVILVEPPPMPLELIRANAVIGPTGPTNALLSWDKSSDPNVTSYRVSRGVASRDYDTSFFTPGTNASFLLVQGQTNFFAVSAISAAGLESDFSNEVSVKAVPTPPPPTNYAIVTLASSNMVNWSAILTNVVSNTGPLMFFRQQIFKIVP